MMTVTILVMVSLVASASEAFNNIEFVMNKINSKGELQPGSNNVE